IDTGVDDEHPDLAGIVIGGADFSGIGTPDGTQPVGPGGFHGTMVSSLIAGQGRNSGGVIGVAPGVELLAVSVGLGVDGADTDAQVAQAIIWSVDNGASVINLSLSRNSERWPASWDEAFLYAFESDVVIVAASGNREAQSYATAPATIPGVLSVTAIDKAGNVNSSAGAGGIGVAVAAPGIDMLGSFPGGEIETWEGSSAAAPIVTGLVALMRQADPVASANDIIQRVISTAVDLGDPGFDGIYGYGLIDPIAAVDSSAVSDSNPLGSLAQWVELYRPAQASDDEAELIVPTLPGTETEAEESAAEPEIQEADPGLNPLTYLLLPIALLLVVLIFNSLRRGKKKQASTTKEGS
ncbi:MAG: peptidase S8, partial [Actinobacteria bacterium]|nr:peptidase S8 [Actinomycetota bacterium]